ncbi:MAG: oligoendopeptidase F, partial [Victivallaceae bacterium]|nr:oligoendopeptidase F [Victivallaceae bacterium]
RGRKQILSEPEERLLGALSNSLGAPERVFEMLNDAELSFGSCRNTEGKLEKLTHGTYRKFLESPDRSVRKGAFTRLYRKYRSFRNTFATILDGNVRVDVAESRIRGFKSALDAALYDDDIPAEVYHNLISTVHGNLGAFYKYVDIRAKALKFDDIDMYDIMPPIVKGCDRTYSFDEARSIVAEALRPLGKEYGRILESAYSDRWIDVPERKGKRSGAYSGGCFDSFPYVLLNFNGTLDDVFTLAHELGHSMHSHFSHTSQPYHYAEYDIFVAEVASTTNEILLYEYLLSKSSSKAERAFLHSHLADEIRGTIYRQTMFAEFELDIHNRCEQGLPLTADYLCDRYYELNSLYYGPNLKADKLISMEWARIPHFYYNFYVYKYATGMSAALKLAQDILSGNTDAYFGFLKAGGSKYPLEIMKDAGVDLSSPEPVDSALKYFDSVVGKLGKALK